MSCVSSHSCALAKAVIYLDTDIMYLQMGDQEMVVLNTWEAIGEIMEKQGANFSDR